MPPYHISCDLKARIPVMCYQLAYSVKEICEVLGVKKSLIYQVLQCHRVHHGAVTPPGRRKAGRCRLLTSTDISFIRSLLSLNHTIYLDEIQEQLLSRRNTRVSIMTLTCTLRRLHLSNKDVSSRAIERNIQDRAVYMNRIADLVPDSNMLMFGDEASKDERTSARRRGWSERGTRCVQRKV
ncbi:hypothetical protein FIBSPDRAFT_705616, partial [Athelia psychrophila]